MTERIIYTPEADDDVAASYHWYESCEPGLGEDFLRCVEACLLTIQRHSHAFPVAVDEFRHAPIRRFPYEIFYEATDDCISSTPSSIVPKILKSGGSGSDISSLWDLQEFKEGH